jgi:hypothetical protein
MRAIAALDGADASGKVPGMNSSRRYFRNSFPGWTFFRPVGWRSRLR